MTLANFGKTSLDILATILVACGLLLSSYVKNITILTFVGAFLIALNGQIEWKD